MSVQTGINWSGLLQASMYCCEMNCSFDQSRWKLWHCVHDSSRYWASQAKFTACNKLWARILRGTRYACVKKLTLEISDEYTMCIMCSFWSVKFIKLIPQFLVETFTSRQRWTVEILGRNILYYWFPYGIWRQSWRLSSSCATQLLYCNIMWELDSLILIRNPASCNCIEHVVSFRNPVFIQLSGACIYQKSILLTTLQYLW